MLVSNTFICLTRVVVVMVTSGTGFALASMPYPYRIITQHNIAFEGRETLTLDEDKSITIQEVTGWSHGELDIMNDTIIGKP